MTIEKWIRKSTLIASYFWEFLAVPTHAERLALLRLAKHRAEFEARAAVEQETNHLHTILDAFARLERGVPGATRPLVQGALSEWVQRCARAGRPFEGSANPDRGRNTQKGR